MSWHRAFLLASILGTLATGCGNAERYDDLYDSGTGPEPVEWPDHEAVQVAADESECARAMDCPPNYECVPSQNCTCTLGDGTVVATEFDSRHLDFGLLLDLVCSTIRSTGNDCAEPATATFSAEMALALETYVRLYDFPCVGALRSAVDEGVGPSNGGRVTPFPSELLTAAVFQRLAHDDSVRETFANFAPMSEQVGWSGISTPYDAHPDLHAWAGSLATRVVFRWERSDANRVCECSDHPRCRPAHIECRNGGDCPAGWSCGATPADIYSYWSEVPAGRTPADLNEFCLLPPQRCLPTLVSVDDMAEASRAWGQ